MYADEVDVKTITNIINNINNISDNTELYDTFKWACKGYTTHNPNSMNETIYSDYKYDTRYSYEEDIIKCDLEKLSLYTELIDRIIMDPRLMLNSDQLCNFIYTDNPKALLAILKNNKAEVSFRSYAEYGSLYGDEKIFKDNGIFYDIFKEFLKYPIIAIDPLTIANLREKIENCGGPKKC